jgi:hypothetical protein
MGSAEFENNQLFIRSHIVTYGNAADGLLTEMIRDEIETMWNEPAAAMDLRNKLIPIVFRITAEYKPNLSPTEIYENIDPSINYFRIEEFAHGHISFVDGIGCNTGYFKLDNLYKGSTTAAHEYGHTLGLVHPNDLDIRGKGIPGIMYPRGTVVDSQFQYNSAATAGDNTNGGTMHPQYRRVRTEDIAQLDLHRLSFEKGKAVIGDFTSVWHPDHRTISPGDFFQTGILG